MSISNILLVESINFHLLSKSQLCDLRFKFVFGADDVETYLWFDQMSYSMVLVYELMLGRF